MTHQLSQPEIGHIEPGRSGKTPSNTSSLSDSKYMYYKDDAHLDGALLTSGKYSIAQVSHMTLNDKMYAVSLLP